MPGSSQLLLAAGFGEIIGALIALLVPVLWVIKQIADAAKPAAGEAAPAARPPAPRPQGAVQAGGGQADPLRQQVEDFLRRAGREPAAARRDQANRPPAQAQQPVSDIELLIDEEPPQPARQPLGEPLRPIESRSPAAKKPPAPPKPAPAPGGKPHRPAGAPQRQAASAPASELAADRPRRLVQQAAHLTQRIVVPDERPLQGSFSHTLGTLGSIASTSVEEVQPSETPAGQLAAMLANPDGVRQAIVLNEVLRRPSDRW